MSVYIKTGQPCPIDDCFGEMVMYQGPVFGQTKPIPTCSICGYKEAPRDPNKTYISW